MAGGLIPTCEIENNIQIRMEYKIFHPLILRLGDPNLKSAKSCKVRLSFAKAFFRSEL